MTGESSTPGEIEQALLRGASTYFDQCRQRIPTFIDQHFHYPGAWSTNRVALGLDLIRAPLNLFWAPIFASACLLRFLVRWLKWQRAADLLGRVSAGLDTRVQQHIARLIYTELLRLESAQSPLEECIVAELELVYDAHNPVQPRQRARLHHQLEPVVEDALQQYSVTRTAAADITNTLSCTVLGAFAFQKFTPGGIGLGFLLAAIWSKHEATRNFFLGEKLGAIYYGWFPPEPGLAMNLGSVLLVLLLLAAFASFAGLLADPLQAAMGVHRRRLNKLIDTLERDFTQRSSGSFRPKDQFVARVLDVFDMVKSNLS